MPRIAWQHRHSRVPGNQEMTELAIELVALFRPQTAAQLDGGMQMLAGVIEVHDLHPDGYRDVGMLTQCFGSIPDPVGPIGNELHHLGIGCAQKTQVADDQREGSLGIPDEDIIQRQAQRVGLTLLTRL